MCVYCVEDAACEHERDACAASGGQPWRVNATS